MISEAPPKGSGFDRPQMEERVLSLLGDGRTRSVEELIKLAPEISWAQLFIAIDILSRRGDISLRRHGFTYSVRKRERYMDGAGGADAAAHLNHR